MASTGWRVAGLGAGTDTGTGTGNGTGAGAKGGEVRCSCFQKDKACPAKRDLNCLHAFAICFCS